MPRQALRPATANARVHSTKQIKQIARSIQRYRFNVPVFIGDYDEIIAGHGRVEAAKQMRQQEEENQKLKRLVADLTLDNQGSMSRTTH